MEKYSNTKDEERKKMVAYIDKVIENSKLSKQIEKSIYNYVITLSKEKNIQRRWTNCIFKNQPLNYQKVSSDIRLAQCTVMGVFQKFPIFPHAKLYN